MPTDRIFEVVPDTERVPARNSTRAPVTIAILEGKTVFVRGGSQVNLAGSLGGTLRSEGKRLVTRRVERDGVKGVMAWAEDREAGA